MKGNECLNSLDEPADLKDEFSSPKVIFIQHEIVNPSITIFTFSHFTSF